MNQQQLNGPSMGLIPRIVAAITGAIVLVGAFIVGIVAWIVLAGFVLIGAVALWIWVWRQRRRFEKHQRHAGDSFIEAEYEVVDRSRDNIDRS